MNAGEAPRTSRLGRRDVLRMMAATTLTGFPDRDDPVFEPYLLVDGTGRIASALPLGIRLHVPIRFAEETNVTDIRVVRRNGRTWRLEREPFADPRALVFAVFPPFLRTVPYPTTRDAVDGEPVHVRIWTPTADGRIDVPARIRGDGKVPAHPKSPLAATGWWIDLPGADHLLGSPVFADNDGALLGMIVGRAAVGRSPSTRPAHVVRFDVPFSGVYRGVGLVVRGDRDGGPVLVRDLVPDDPDGPPVGSRVGVDGRHARTVAELRAMVDRAIVERGFVRITWDGGETVRETGTFVARLGVI